MARPKKLCSIEGCNRWHKAAGFCGKHYQKFRTYGDPSINIKTPRGLTDKEKLLFRSKLVGSCLEWTGYLCNKGYGRIGRNGKTVAAHRLAYESNIGPIQDGLHVLHRCDNRKCINPDHLFLGTHKDNMVDRNEKGRQARLVGESHGCSKLTNEDIPKIRAMASSGMKYIDISKHFPVGPQAISMVVRGKKWGHIK